MKKFFSTFFAFFCLCTLIFCIGISAFGSLATSDIYGKVLRLHVIANSNSSKDQELKYKVRDGILDLTGKLFCDCDSVDDALKTANLNMDRIRERAEQVLRENGCDKSVQIVIGRENYPEKKYLDLTFPKGEYLSVRVLIGNGNGKNWWCVLFPPLCNANAEQANGLISSYGIDEKEAMKLKEEENDGIVIFGCRVKLKILDLFK